MTDPKTKEQQESDDFCKAVDDQIELTRKKEKQKREEFMMKNDAQEQVPLRILKRKPQK